MRVHDEFTVRRNDLYHDKHFETLKSVSFKQNIWISPSIWCCGRVSALHVAVSVSIPGRVGIFNNKLSPWNLEGWWSRTSIASFCSKYIWVNSQIPLQCVCCEGICIVELKTLKKIAQGIDQVRNGKMVQYWKVTGVGEEEYEELLFLFQEKNFNLNPKLYLDL